MRAILAIAAFGVLAACAVEPPVLTAREVFRDPGAQIASQTNVTSKRMAGDWVIRQRFAGLPAIGEIMRLSVLPDGALQMTVAGPACEQAGCTQGDTLVLLNPTGPGRWMPVDPPAGMIDREIWVMWMDFDTRTAAIGTPSGSFGWIMDKNPTGGRDRILAARDIMDWFGYTVSRLEEVNP